jgi:hypothetical protein
MMLIFVHLAAEKHGWSYDASHQYLSPAPPPSAIVTPGYAHGMHQNADEVSASTEDTHDFTGPSSLNTFNLVADSTAKLEM